MKRFGISLLVCTIFLAGNLIAVAQTNDPAQVVATVNGEEILQSSLDLIITRIVIPQFQAQNPGKELSAEQKKMVEGNILNQLVTQQLILQVAAKSNLMADEAMVNQRFDAFKAQRPEVADEHMRQLIADEILTQQTVQQEVISKVTLTDEEAQNYYNERKDQFNQPEQVQTSHILIQVAQDAPQEEKDAAKKKIQEILTMAKEGKDFAELAKEYSEGPSKENGGDLGFFAKGVMVKPFEDAAFALDEGAISDVVETQFGYHIIKVTGKKAQRTAPFEEVKAQIKQRLLQQKINLERRNWVEALKSNATIEIMGEGPAVSTTEAPTN